MTYVTVVRGRWYWKGKAQGRNGLAFLRKWSSPRYIGALAIRCIVLLNLSVICRLCRCCWRTVTTIQRTEESINIHRSLSHTCHETPRDCRKNALINVQIRKLRCFFRRQVYRLSSPSPALWLMVHGCAFSHRYLKTWRKVRSALGSFLEVSK